MGKKLTIEEFIAKARLVHGNKYDYSKVVYINNSTKVIIACLIHGKFEQSPNKHMQGRGCSECGKISRRNTRSSNTNEFITKAKEIHNNKYNYSKVNYINSKSKVTITCPIHGDFEQTPNSHLKNGGCDKCGRLKSNEAKKITQEEFINRAINTHKNVYDYSKVVYINNHTKVNIVCITHGDFEQISADHLNGHGCPSCAKYGFQPDQSAYLYYLKITTEDNQILYKIGITNRTVNERFNLTDLSKIEIVKQKLYENGQEAYDWEQKLKQTYKQYQYKGPNILSSGNTELFTEDIIAMYYKENQLE